MAKLRFEITNYEVVLARKIGYGVGGFGTIYCSCWMTCKGAAGEVLEVLFVNDPTAAKNFTDLNRKYGTIIAASNHYPNYVDILRNEKPVFAVLDSVAPDAWNVVTTGQEPVGEGE